MGWRSASKAGEMVGRLATLISMSWLVGSCIDVSQSPLWELAGEPGLLLPVKQHYEFRAIEEEVGRRELQRRAQEIMAVLSTT